jgi:hypothetical protein
VTAPESVVISQPKGRLKYLGLGDASHIEAGHVVRMAKACPVDDDRDVDIVRECIAGHCPNVVPVGRNGTHRYRDDHFMYTARLSVESIDRADHDLWSVNAEDERREEAGT